MKVMAPDKILIQVPCPSGPDGSKKPCLTFLKTAIPFVPKAPGMQTMPSLGSEAPGSLLRARLAKPEVS